MSIIRIKFYRFHFCAIWSSTNREERIHQTRIRKCTNTHAHVNPQKHIKYLCSHIHFYGCVATVVIYRTDLQGSGELSRSCAKHSNVDFKGSEKRKSKYKIFDCFASSPGGFRHTQYMKSFRTLAVIFRPWHFLQQCLVSIISLQCFFLITLEMIDDVCMRKR